jgi:preprotein translocase subunit Sec61beta
MNITPTIVVAILALIIYLVIRKVLNIPEDEETKES